jgi:hypothetical protein
MEKLPKIKYCGCKHSNNGHCQNIATYLVKLRTRGNESPNAETVSGFRCSEHQLSGTNGKKVIEVYSLDQSSALQKINEFLKSLIGTKIRATVHSAKELEVKYLKENGAVMCFQPITKKWKYVYYHQVIL